MSLNKLSNEEQAKLGELRKIVEDEISGLARLDTEAKKSRNEDIKSMIKYFNGLTAEIEGRRSRLNDLTLQLLAITLTGFGLLVSQRESLSKQWGAGGDNFVFLPLAVILGSQVLFSLVSLLFYERQSGFRYPFLKLETYGANRWKWFYYGNEHILRINANSALQSNRFQETHEPYLKGLEYFVHNYRTETAEKEISENVQQLYLLQVHNYYKNRFYLELVRIRSISIYFVFIVIGFTGVLYLIEQIHF